MKLVPFLIASCLSTVAYSYDEINQKQLSDTVKKMDQYAKEINLDEDRQKFRGTYIAPIKVSTRAEFDFIKNLFMKYEVATSQTNFKHTICNQVGVQYAYLDFLKMNKHIGKDVSTQIKLTENSIRGYSSLYKSQTGKFCGEK